MNTRPALNTGETEITRVAFSATGSAYTKPETRVSYIETIAVPFAFFSMIRAETCGCAEGFAKEATEIQNIQIAGMCFSCRGLV